MGMRDHARGYARSETSEWRVKPQVQRTENRQEGKAHAVRNCLSTVRQIGLTSKSSKRQSVESGEAKSSHKSNTQPAKPTVKGLPPVENAGMAEAEFTLPRDYFTVSGRPSLSSREKRPRAAAQKPLGFYDESSSRFDALGRRLPLPPEPPLALRSPLPIPDAPKAEKPPRKKERV